ncbi:MAG: lysophospholipid acyltransferase family protein [Saprospiraceae bacterium]|nr:lysophospholipid acyltransferase family protein [Saprospiraceae bacterium]
MSQIVYYLIVKPLSLLPLPALYLLSDFLYVVLYHLAGFRKKVVWSNLTGAFPDKPERDLRRIMRLFYRHFCDLLVESIRMFSMSKEEGIRRCKLVNPEVLETHYNAGRSIILVAGHYNNWELAAMAFDLQAPHKTIGIYTPLTNPFFEKKIQTSRGKYGMIMLPKQRTAEFFEEQRDRLNLYLMGADQSPTYAKKVYWMTFLGRETAVAFGTEKYAKQYDYPVVFGHIRKVRRGIYEMWFEDVETQPLTAPHGRITEAHTRVLEQDILAAPQYWLWTHKRWKRKRKEGEE